MNVLRFQARSSAEAIRQIRAQLGAEAIVLSVTPLPAKGLSRLWRRPGLEVLAGLPDAPEPEANPQITEPSLPTSARPSTGRLLDERAGEQDPISLSHTLEPELRRAPLSLPAELPARSPQGAANAQKAFHSAGRPGSQRRSEDSAPNEVVSEWTAPVLGRSNGPLAATSDSGKKVESFGTYYVRERARAEGAKLAAPEPLPATPADVARFEVPKARSTAAGSWRTGALLQQMGLLPLCIDQVLDRVRAAHGEQPPAAFADEFALVKAALGAAWQTPSVPPKGFPAIHVFIGPPGSGKTTALCKWLAKSVLVERQMPRTWRLDSRTANFAGLLDFYSEIFNVPLEREWRGLSALPGFDLGFVDLPGTNPHDTVALQQLRTRLQAIPAGQVHLVLNAAYEVPVLLAQVRAFAGLPVSDLILTHLDEEKRRGKLWNLVLGTNLPVRFLSGGQNIPGDFSPATPEQLFAR